MVHQGLESTLMAYWQLQIQAIFPLVYCENHLGLLLMELGLSLPARVKNQHHTCTFIIGGDACTKFKFFFVFHHVPNGVPQVLNVFFPRVFPIALGTFIPYGLPKFLSVQSWARGEALHLCVQGQTCFQFKKKGKIKVLNNNKEIFFHKNLSVGVDIRHVVLTFENMFQVCNYYYYYYYLEVQVFS